MLVIGMVWLYGVSERLKRVYEKIDCLVKDVIIFVY